jgi:O-antigen ligase
MSEEILHVSTESGAVVRRPPQFSDRGLRQGTSSRPVSTRSSAGREWNRLLSFSLSLAILVFVGRVHEAIPGLSAIPMGNIAVLLSAIGLVQLGLHRDVGRILGTSEGILVVGLVGVAALSLPFALWRGAAFDALLAFLKTLALFVLIVMAVRQPKQIMQLMTVFAIGAAILVYPYVQDWLFGAGDLTEQGMVAFDRNDVALVSVMGIPFAIAMTAKRGLWSWAGFALAGFLALGVMASDSRGGFLALAATGAFMLVRSRALSTGKKMALVAVGVVVVTVGGSSEYWDRIEAIFTSTSSDYNVTSRDGRIQTWKRGIGYFLDNPLTGVGIGNFPVAEGETLEDLGFGIKWSNAHSAYVLAAAELGIGGLVLFLALLWQVYRQASKTERMTRHSRAPPARELEAVAEATRFSLIGFAVAAAFLSVTFSVAFVFLVALGACLGLLKAGRQVRAHPVRQSRMTGRN